MKKLMSALLLVSTPLLAATQLFFIPQPKAHIETFTDVPPVSNSAMPVQTAPAGNQCAGQSPRIPDCSWWCLPITTARTVNILLRCWKKLSKTSRRLR
ncbi:hypothetical protein BL250_04275 [Erwinia sp. OLTSP20]|nr:hypothetical protein BV501_03205 [Erwinia sp. OAMSP11]PIJ75598.1 hypothetical protein BK416_01500 [Erwinia sp. OLSSP12]PIJ84903.1 hypothetical protein BLD47_01430 [Erwinia sp. OLCASP19]PIJ86682.1 hypothetical protein BLD46_03030 [Erwinia sp. OLMTSP26]PIJ88123.1 hypothetical protein BLD49_03710 [Erwinia sp. OLMDSP33]PIJ94179.1 hypothetical protein BL250_04275 [Erwinia sp. OLTSP20]PIJ94461.1 hypothetical protein BL249_02550 [Erwinia sp. OLFS4]